MCPCKKREMSSLVSEFLSGRGGGWSGGAMVLGKLWLRVEQGPIALAVGTGGVVWTFLPSAIFSLPFLPLSGRRPDID